jgi:hypothetical protein
MNLIIKKAIDAKLSLKDLYMQIGDNENDLSLYCSETTEIFKCTKILNGIIEREEKEIIKRDLKLFEEITKFIKSIDLDAYKRLNKIMGHKSTSKSYNALGYMSSLYVKNFRSENVYKTLTEKEKEKINYFSQELNIKKAEKINQE